MRHELDNLLRNEPAGEPRPAWVDTTRRRVLERVRHRRSASRQAVSWLAGGAALAAAVVLAVTLGLPGPGPGFAEVQRKMRAARSVTFDTAVDVGREGAMARLVETHSWIDQEFGSRSDVTLAGAPIAQLWLPRQGEPILVDHLHRAVMRVELPAALDPGALLGMDPAALVRRIAAVADPAERVTTEADDLLIGFEIDASALHLPDGADVALWVDRATLLPAKVACRVPLRDGQVVTWTTDDFTWGEPIDAGALLLEFPPDYDHAPAIVVPPPSAEAMARTLRRYADLSGGAFPSSEMPAWETLVRLLGVSLRPVGAWDALPPSLRGEQGQREAIADVVAGALFLIRLQESGVDLDYDGHRVRLGDEAPLLRWRDPAGVTHTIFGDLETETTPP